jgi:hypothetical protein
LEKVQATLKLRDAEITRLTGELIQEGVSYEELRQAGEEKDAMILKLQRSTETARAALETMKKHVEGKLLFLLFVCRLNSLGSATNLIRIFAFRPTDGSRDDDDPSRGDPDGLQLLSTGAGGPAGCSSRGVPERGGGRRASRELHGEPPPCLGRHVTRRVRRALHLGVQKAFGVVASHYRVNLGVISTSYVIPEGLDDEGAEVEMNRVDALAAPTANVLAEDFMEILFPDTPPADPLEP